MSDTLQLAKDLISKASVTPKDKGCQLMMTDHLKKIGFSISDLKFGEVDNSVLIPLTVLIASTQLLTKSPLGVRKG